MKVLVCGGRNYSNGDAVFAVLDNIHARTPITCIIEGGATGADWLASGDGKMSIGLVKATRKPLYCSFCGKEQDEVGYLVAGPTVFICNECVELCREIGQEMLCESPAPHATAPSVPSPMKVIKLKPR